MIDWLHQTLSCACVELVLIAYLGIAVASLRAAILSARIAAAELQRWVLNKVNVSYAPSTQLLGPS